MSHTNQRNQKSVGFRLTIEQFQKLSALAAQVGLTPHEFTKRVILSGKYQMPDAVPSDYPSKAKEDTYLTLHDLSQSVNNLSTRIQTIEDALEVSKRCDK